MKVKLLRCLIVGKTKKKFNFLNLHPVPTYMYSILVIAFMYALLLIFIVFLFRFVIASKPVMRVNRCPFPKCGE